MPGAYKLHTLAVVVLATIFVFFFFTSKHDPSFGNINPYGEDPYDAIGSVGIQVALLTALLSLLRVFRPYHKEQLGESRRLLLIRLWAVCLLSIILTLMTDMIALLRFSSMWTRSAGVNSLLLLVVSMTVATFLISWSTLRLARGIAKVPPSTHRRESVLILLVCILILALYPTDWRQSVGGATATAAAGFVLLFLMTWSLTRALFSPLVNSYEDSLDDLTAVYQLLRNRGRIARNIFEAVEQFFRLPTMRRLVDWINPRKHKWNLPLIVAATISILLTFIEMLEEGILPGTNRFWLLVVIFVGAEMLAILLGYALLAQYLGIFRDERVRTTTEVT